MWLCAVVLVAVAAAFPQLPFTFDVGGQDFASLCSERACGWEHQSHPLDANRIQTVDLLADAVTGLVVNVSSVSYSLPAGATALEWVVWLSANGSVPTPTVSNLALLNTTLATSGAAHIHRFRGSNASDNDFGDLVQFLWTGPPELLANVRLWGASRRLAAASAEDCISACQAAADCLGMSFTNLTDWAGCGLVTEYVSSTMHPGFVSWLRFPKTDDEFAPALGRSSNGILPYFSVMGTQGRAKTVSVGWSGGWQARVSLEGAAQARIVVAHQGWGMALQPGQRLRTMRVLVVDWPASEYGWHAPGFNLHRRILLDYKVPRKLDQPPPPALPWLGALVTSVSWFGFPQYPNLTLASQTWHLNAVKATAAIEAYWLDAGWFPGGFPEGVGNWVYPDLGASVDADEFPGRTLAPLAAGSHAAPNAVQFIVWFEPERVAPGSYLWTQHPEFLLKGPSWSTLLNLGNATARGYMTAYLSASVSAYGLDVLRLDYNIDPATIWAAADTAGQAGVTEALYIDGLYGMWDTVLAEHPGLLIDNCASGGRRIDLETLSRSVPLWRTDDTGTSEKEQVTSMGLTHFAPISNGPIFSWDPYAWRSSGVVGKNACWGQAGYSTLLANATEMAALRAAMAELARIRPAALWGDYYALTPVAYEQSGWAAYQFHCEQPACDAAASVGFLYAFRRPQSAMQALTLQLRALRPTATYTTRMAHSYTPEPPVSMSGQQLAALVVTLAQPASSVLLEYREE